MSYEIPEAVPSTVQAGLRATGASPTLAVVIPTCDRNDLLHEALSCVLRQTLAPDEILIINNGNAPVQLRASTTSVRVLDIPRHAGVAQARNFGASLATADYVAFLDDDDLWEDFYLEAIAGLIDEQAPDCVVGRLDQLQGGEVRAYKNAHGRLSLGELFLRNPGVTGSTTVVRRRAFLDVSGYDPCLPPSEDKSLVIDLLLQGRLVVSAPDAVAIHRQHGGERLSNIARVVASKRLFLERYRDRMTSRQRREVARKIAYLRYHSGQGWGAAFRYLLLSAILRLTRSRAGEAPARPDSTERAHVR